MMKHFLKTLLLLSSATCLSSCQEYDSSAVGNRPVKVTFSITDQPGYTRVAGAGEEDEAAVLHWSLLLFRDGELADYGSSDSTEPITRELEGGTYTACAVVNAPASFQPGTVQSLEGLDGTVSDLEDHALPGLIMVGKRSLRIPEDTEDGIQTIHVDRLVFKAGVRKISVRMEDPAVAARTFILQGVYLTNCPRKTRLGTDYTRTEIPSDQSFWANRMGFQSDASVNGLLSDTGIDATLPSGSSHSVPHYFYGCPNPVGTGSDTRSRSSWSPRCTRIVIEATIGGTTYYYPISLPATSRNKTYIAEEAVIRGLGSLDPEEEVPGALEVDFSTSIEDWGPEYQINEKS